MSKAIRIELGPPGTIVIEKEDDDDGNCILHSSLARQVCAVCKGVWCCNPEHESELDVEEVGHHPCVDRIRFNGALDGVEAMALDLFSQGCETAVICKAVSTAYNALENNIYA